MHDNEWSLNPQTVESDKQVAAELEKLLYTQDAAVPKYEPERHVERKRGSEGNVRRFGQGILNFFTSEKIFFFRIIDDEKPASRD